MPQVSRVQTALATWQTAGRVTPHTGPPRVQAMPQLSRVQKAVAIWQMAGKVTPQAGPPKVNAGIPTAGPAAAAAPWAWIAPAKKWASACVPGAIRWISAASFRTHRVIPPCGSCSLGAGARCRMALVGISTNFARSAPR